MLRIGARAVAPPGYFIFSKPNESRNSLKGWEEHFHKLGIPTVVLQQENGTWVLCREGEEALSEPRDIK
jgi:hypothetical protein